MQAFQDVSQNPQNVSKYDHLPKGKMIIDKLAEKFGPAGEGPPPDTSFPGGMPFGDMFGGQWLREFERQDKWKSSFLGLKEKDSRFS